MSDNTLNAAPAIGGARRRDRGTSDRQLTHAALDDPKETT
jgi:hypothetical protein